MPAWVSDAVTATLPLLERYRGPWKKLPDPTHSTLIPEGKHLERLEEVQVVEALCGRMEVVTTALGQGKFTLEAWVAAVDILELFGSARPMDRSLSSSPDALVMAWFVLTRNAATYFLAFENDPGIPLQPFPSNAKAIAETVLKLVHEDHGAAWGGSGEGVESNR
jgi:hypothetical protein